MNPWINFFLLVGFLSTLGCQSIQEKNELLVKDRAEKLKPLSSWKAISCHLETRLTEPARARYEQMFPKEKEILKHESWGYNWKARETVCEIRSMESNPVIRNHQSFIESAMCLLFQVHYVNSPFDELKIGSEDIQRLASEMVHVKVSGDPSLGLYLDPQAFSIETQTKSRGLLRARYRQTASEWLPERLEQKTPVADLVIDQIEYEPDMKDGRRRLLGFQISLGAEQTFAHTLVKVSDCEAL